MQTRTTSRDGMGLRRPSSASAVARGIQARMAGPGGCYNLGNLIGLTVGIALQIAAASDGSGGGTAAVRAYLVGTPSATALSVATLFFLWSGELYHRAWAASASVRDALVRRADLLSCLGACVLSLALLLVGEALLAAVSGTLLAGGKLGTALADPSTGAGRRLRRASSLFRGAVLLSRAPAILLLLIEIVDATALDRATMATAAVIAPATLLVCHLLWAAADVLLLARSDCTCSRSL